MKSPGNMGTLSMRILKRALGEEEVKELLAKYESGKKKAATSPGQRNPPTEDQVRIAEFIRDGNTIAAAREKFGLTNNSSVDGALRRVAIWRYVNRITD